MIVENNIDKLRVLVNKWQRDGLEVCLVPTMGFFHDGHLALMKKGLEIADKVVVSLFVNPTQFGPGEDLENYPKDLAGDFTKAKEIGVDLVFCPNSDDVYAEDHKSFVTVKELSEGLCGKDRPVHFRGVTTIVTKLLNMVQPQYVVFGEKDFQQLTIIRQMVKDLNIPVKVIGHPVVREADGLAMSSRNAYLNDDERKVAVCLYQALCKAKELIVKGRKENVKVALESAEQVILQHRQCSLDYFTMVDSNSLKPLEEVSSNCIIVGAIKINNNVRLIDNMRI